MARLPQVGGDSGDWGTILNEFLVESHNADGTLKNGILDKTDIGLANVDNTADADKPISTATQSALNTKTSNPMTTAGDLVYGGASGVPTRLPSSTTANRVLTVSSAGGNPSWAQVPLDSAITGTLPVANGGTGRVTNATAYGIIAAGTTATGAQQTITPGTAGQFLKSNGAASLASFSAIAQSDVTNLTTDLTSKVDKVTSTDNAVARFDGTTGALQNSSVTISDAGNLGIGRSPQYPLDITSSDTTLSGTVRAMNFEPIYSPASDNGSGLFMLASTFAPAYTSSVDKTVSGSFLGAMYVSPKIAGSGVTRVKGIDINYLHNTTGTVPLYMGIEVRQLAVTTGSVAQAYGVRVSDLSAATTAEAISIGGTGVKNAIVFAGDTNLYRSSANMLKTDDSLDVAGNITTAGTVDGLKLATYAMGSVVHGAVASTARPAGYATVTWIGSVAPTNALTNDIWLYKA